MKILLALVLVASWISIQSPPADYSIDLTALNESTEEEMLTVPIAERVITPPAHAFVVGTPTPEVPFELSSLSFDRSDYNLGDEFTYELTLRHLGSGDFTFPNSRQRHLFRQAMSGLRKVSVSVEIDDPSLRHQTIDVQALYGSEDIQGSLITLAANQTVRLRGQGRWRLSAVDPPLSQSWSGNVMPFAGLDVYYTPQGYRRGKSAAVAIHLARSQGF